MRIIWSSRAETDLYNHIGYIAQRSKQNAKQVLKNILELVEKLPNNPYKFQKERGL